MKILVVGGTGHVGTFLCEILKERGHEAVIASRGSKTPPKGMKSAICDSSEINTLIPLRRENFDAVVDFPGTTMNVYNAFAGYVKHIIGCGSLWMFGVPGQVPTPEKFYSKCPFKGYAKRYEEMEVMLKDEKSLFTAIMPPNICGPGKIPVEGLGGRDIEVHKAHKRGELVYLPDGPECLISPCDAYDIAMLFVLAAENPDKSGNEIINVGAGEAMTASEFVKTYSDIYGSNIPIEYVPWKKYAEEISPSVGHYWHFYSHMCPDISKARKLLSYKPKYSCRESMERAVKWMKDNGLLD